MIYYDIGLIYLELGPENPENALVYFKKSLEIIKKELSEHDITLCLSYKYIGQAYYKLNELDSALKYYKEAEKFAEKKLDRKNKDFSGIYLLQARVYYQMKDYYYALEYYQKSLKLLE